MSVNIQTPAGLLKISGDRVTKETINKALGYTPVNVDELPDIFDDASDYLVIVDASGNIATRIDEQGVQTVNDVVIQTTTDSHSVVSHIEDGTRHITDAERANWNNKSYTELTDAPNILEDESGELQIADNSGNVIMSVNENGVTTHDVAVNGSGETVAQHHSNTVSHITVTERTKWDNKSDFSGDYHDLTNQPNIEEDESGMIQIADSNGNIIAQIDDAGITTHEIIVEGEGLGQKLKDHEADMVSHITSAERVTWNNKSEFSGNYNDLVDAPSIHEEEDGTELVIADNDGNIITRIDSEGLATHDVIVSRSGESVAEHHNNTTSHITANERTSWNNKSEFSGNYTDLIGEPNITEDESGELSIADSEGNIIARVDETGITAHEVIVNGTALGDIAVKHDARINTLERLVVGPASNDDPSSVPLVSKVEEHIENSDVHVTTDDKTRWDGKTTMSEVEAKDYATNTRVASLEGTVNTHTSDTNIHITAEERVAWNNKSEFSGNYTDLTGEPNITEDESAELNVADPSGNVILRLDETGARTRNIVIGPHEETPEDPIWDVAETLKSHKAHADDTVVHVTQADKDYWNEKPTWSGVDGKFVTKETFDSHVTDNNEHVETFNKHVAAYETHTKLVTATEALPSHVTLAERTSWNAKPTTDEVETAITSKKYATQANLDATNKALNETDAALTEHTSNTTIHVTADDKLKWNNKSEFSGNYTDLEGEPDIQDEGETQKELTIADITGNIAFRIGEDGARVQTLIVGPEEETEEFLIYDVGVTLKNHADTIEQNRSDFDSHVDDTVHHITSSERTTWNNMAPLKHVQDTYVTIESHNKHTAEFDTHTQAFSTHATDTTSDISHITKAQRDSWNAKPTVSEVDTQITNKNYVPYSVYNQHTAEFSSHKSDVTSDVCHITPTERSKWDNKTTLTEAENMVVAKDYATNHTVNQVSAALNTHTSNSTIHVTAEDKLSWNNKSEFSGNYTDLVGEPDIIDEGESQKELTVADSSGNVKLRVDEDGARVDVLVVGPHEATTDRPVYDVGQTLKLHADTIAQDRGDFNNHDNDSVRHITAAERTSWNGKTTYSAIETDFVKQSIFNQHTGEFSAHTSDKKMHVTEASQKQWNTAASKVETIYNNYATSTALTSHVNNAASTYATKDTVNELSAQLTDHKTVRVGTNNPHVTSEERLAWNNKPDSASVSRSIQAAISSAGHAKQTDLDTTNTNLTSATAKIDNHLSATNMHFSGEYTDLKNVPHIKEDESGELIIADSYENIIMRIGEDGAHVTSLLLGTSNTVDVAMSLSNLDRRLIEVGDLRGGWGVESEFVTDYSRHNDGTARAYVETHMFETFYIHPEYSNTYTVQVVYDEWAGNVCDRRILAEKTGTHTVIVSRVDGAAVTTAELGTISNVVEHIKTAFSIYFDKLHKITIEAGNAVDESSLSFDTTKIITAE